MIGIINDRRDGSKHMAMLRPRVTVVGEIKTQKIKHKYKRVMMHYYDRWYDYAAKMSERNKGKQIEIIDPINVNSYDIDYFPNQKKIDGYNPPGEADNILPPDVTMFIQSKDYTYSNKKNSLINIYKNFTGCVSEEEGIGVYRVNFKKIDYCLQGGSLFHHLLILIHGFTINHEVRKTCKSISKEFPCDFVEIFENKIYIHTSGTSDDDLFGDLIQKEIKPKIQKKKIYEAFMVDGTPKLKLVHYKKVY